MGEPLDSHHEDWKSRAGRPSGRRPIEYIGEDITTGKRERAAGALETVVEVLGQLEISRVFYFPRNWLILHDAIRRQRRRLCDASEGGNLRTRREA